MPSWPRRALYSKQFTDARGSFRASRRVASPTYGPEAPVFIVFVNGLLGATGCAGARRLHGIAAFQLPGVAPAGAPPPAEPVGVPGGAVPATRGRSPVRG